MYFYHYVTFRFLNCIETSSQADLLKLLPKLHQDLLSENTGTLKDFIVSIHRILTPTLSCDTSYEIVERMLVRREKRVHYHWMRDFTRPTPARLVFDVEFKSRW